MTDNFRTVDVTVKLPEPLVNFLKALEQFTGRDPAEYMATAISDVVLTDLDQLQAALPETPNLKQKYQLDKIEEEAPSE